MGMSADDLSGMRSTVNAFLADSCVNSRTGETHACMLTVATRMERLSSLPRYVRLPVFDIELSDGANVKASDTLTFVTTKGTYSVLEVLNPGTFSVSTDVTAILARRPDGSVGIRADASVSFRQRYARSGHTQPDTIGPFEVMVDYLDPEAVPAGTDFSFRIAMTWDASVAFPDLQKPSEGDFVIWTGVANGKAALRFPRPLVVLPALTAYLEGTPA